MEITRLGILILGLGLAVPSTLIVLANIIEKITLGNLYVIDFDKLATMYLVALIGWFMVFGLKGM